MPDLTLVAKVPVTSGAGGVKKESEKDPTKKESSPTA